MSRLGLWHKKLKDIIAEANKRGLKVEYCTDKYSKDYIGMNPEAAKAMGWPCKRDTISVDRSLSSEDKYHVIKHELIEYDRMKKGWNYHDSHVYALEHE